MSKISFPCRYHSQATHLKNVDKFFSIEKGFVFDIEKIKKKILIKTDFFFIKYKIFLYQIKKKENKDESINLTRLTWYANVATNPFLF